MNCQQAQEMFGEYWDLQEGDSKRASLERHLLECGECAEEFRIWEESGDLIRGFADESAVFGPVDHVNKGVMDRIYAEQSWLMPVGHRTYQFTAAFRMKAAAVIAACMAIFLCGFFYLVFGTPAEDQDANVFRMTGLLDTANAASDATAVGADFYDSVPVASISDPIVLQVVPTVPHYWIALSLFGMIAALLILNWLSRTRS